MGIADDAVEIRSRGWRTLAALHGIIEAALEKDLTAHAGLSVVEFTLLDALNHQAGHPSGGPAPALARAVRR